MNTSRLTTLRWNDLVNSKMIGNDILIEYTYPVNGLVTNIFIKKVKVIGTDYVGKDRILLVYDPKVDDIFIIKRDDQGYLWDAYMEV